MALETGRQEAREDNVRRTKWILGLMTVAVWAWFLIGGCESGHHSHSTRPDSTLVDTTDVDTTVVDTTDTPPDSTDCGPPGPPCPDVPPGQWKKR